MYERERDNPGQIYSMASRLMPTENWELLPQPHGKVQQLPDQSEKDPLFVISHPSGFFYAGRISNFPKFTRTIPRKLADLTCLLNSAGQSTSQFLSSGPEAP